MTKEINHLLKERERGFGFGAEKRERERERERQPEKLVWKARQRQRKFMSQKVVRENKETYVSYV